MTITVCIPVWNGAAFVSETIRSVQAQTLSDVRVHISVDRSDDSSLSVCRSFEDDRRIRVTEQAERLGWVGNTNWLLRSVDTPLACMLPHDDILLPAYLERMAAHLQREPAALMAFSDIRTFGREEVTIVQPSVTGDVCTRIVTFLSEHFNAVGYRGLFRTQIFERGRFLREDAAGFAADTLWLLELAGAGELHRVPELLYRKRLHETAETTRWAARPVARRESDWIEHCLACHHVAMAAAPWSDEQRQVVATAVMARLARLGAVGGAGLPPITAVANLVAAAAHFGLRLTDAAPPGSRPPAIGELPARLRAQMASQIGVAHAAAGRSKAAEAAQREAISLDPGLALAHVHLATILELQDRLDEAAEAARSAVGLAPEAAQLHSRLGHILAKQGALAEAEVALCAAIEAAPDDVSVRRDHANLLKRLGRADEAIEAMRTAVRERPHQPRFHHIFGNLLAAAGRFDEAAAEQRKAIALQPDLAWAHRQLSAALFALGDADEAIHAAREAVRLAPQSDSFRRQLEDLQAARPSAAETWGSGSV